MNVITLWSDPQPKKILAATLVAATPGHPARGVILNEDNGAFPGSPYWIDIVYQLPDGRWRTDGDPATYWDADFSGHAWAAYRKRADGLLVG